MSSLSVAFINQSRGATAYQWDFGDGVTSALENPTHTYVGGGAYVVTLRATGPAGVDVVSRTVITVGVASDVFLGASGGDVVATSDGDLIAVPS